MTTQPQEDPNKQAFLRRVRDALGRTEPTTIAPDYPPLKTSLLRHEEKVRTIQAKNEARRPRILAKLAENAAKAGWNVHPVETPEAAAALIADIAAQASAKKVVRSAEPIFQTVDLDNALRRKHINWTVLASGRNRRRSELKDIAFEADLGVCGVAYAIAETASCAIMPHKGLARLTSLAPPTLVLLVEAEQAVESLDDFFALMRLQYLQPRSKGPNYFNFISGPSKTADIEMVLTTGVHGPGVVHMVLIS